MPTLVQRSFNSSQYRGSSLKEKKRHTEKGGGENKGVMERVMNSAVKVLVAIYMVTMLERALDHAIRK